MKKHMAARPSPSRKRERTEESDVMEQGRKLLSDFEESSNQALLLGEGIKLAFFVSQLTKKKLAQMAFAVDSVKHDTMVAFVKMCGKQEVFHNVEVYNIFEKSGNTVLLQMFADLFPHVAARANLLKQLILLFDFDGTLGTWLPKGTKISRNVRAQYPDHPVFDRNGKIMFFAIRPGWPDIAYRLLDCGVKIFGMTATHGSLLQPAKQMLGKDIFRQVYSIDQFEAKLTEKNVAKLFEAVMDPITQSKNDWHNALLIDDNASCIASPEEVGFEIPSWNGIAGDDKMLNEVFDFFMTAHDVSVVSDFHRQWKLKHPEFFTKEKIWVLEKRWAEKKSMPNTNSSENK